MPHFLTPPSADGIYTTGKYAGLRDGDTPKVDLPIFGLWVVRLHNTWADEQCTPLGKLATQYLDEILRDGVHPLRVWLLPPQDLDGDGRITMREILKTSSFDRWPGTVFVGSYDVRQILIEAHHAVWREYGKN